MSPSTPMDDAIDKVEVEDDETWVTLAEAKQLTGLQARWIADWSRVKKLPTRWDEKGGALYSKHELLTLAESKRKRRAKADPVTTNDDQATATENASSAKSSVRAISGLRPHPINQRIYGLQHEPRLLESVKAQGVLTPLSITRDGLVVSGSERLWAATEAGLAEVPVVVVDVTGETEILLKVLEANVARLKTNEQRVQEYRLYKEIEAARAQQRAGTRTDLGKNFSQGEAGRSRDLAAAKVGWSGPTAQKGLQVLIAIDERTHTANMQTVEEVRSTLNGKSVDAAYNRALALGWLGAATPAKKRKKADMESAKAAYARVQTAAKQLVASIKPDKVAQLSPMQVQKLRQVLQPLMKWLDTLESREYSIEPFPEEARRP